MNDRIGDFRPIDNRDLWVDNGFSHESHNKQLDQLARIEEMLWILMPTSYKCCWCRNKKATTNRISENAFGRYTIYFCAEHADKFDGKERLKNA